MQVPRGPLRGAAAGGGGSLTLGKQPAIPGLEEQGLPGVEPVRSRLGLSPAQPPPPHTPAALWGPRFPGAGQHWGQSPRESCPGVPEAGSWETPWGPLAVRPGSAPVKILLHLGL